jgi:crotonobetainyl-CoA:carnitine CoA-transferase CaiB-like acyl-CoA transferase
VLPLDDLVVFDLSRVLSGPYCSMYLGDFGARVVKLERPGEGDDTRSYGPPFVAGEACYYLSVNRNKESLALDLKHPDGQALAKKLAARADVVLENFRPGALARLGLGPSELMAANPRLIYASISGFGHHGAPGWTSRPGYDLVVQGMGGIPSITGDPGGAPSKVGASIADMVAGLYALVGILVALHARGRTGRGQHVDVSMLDGQISLLTYHAASFLMAGEPARRLGNAHPSVAPYETFQAADGWLNIAVGNDSLWRTFAHKILGRPELATDPRYATNAARVAGRDELVGWLAPLVRARPAAVWLAELEAAGIPCGPILDVGQALAHPAVVARNMVTSVEHPTAGRIALTGVPVRLGETPGSVRTAPPRLGEHSAALLAELCGVGAAEFAALERAGVVARAEKPA